MNTPLATYNIAENKVDYVHLGNVVWAALLDKRYKIEVVRLDGQTHQGTLVIYDNHSNDEEIYSENTALAYGSLFGPDVMDLERWQEIACKVVDSR